MKKHSPYLLSFIVLLIGCSVAALFGEVTLRLTLPNNIPELPPPQALDPYGENPYIVQRRPYLYFHIPFAEYTAKRSYYAVHYEINSNGFRGPEFPPKTKEYQRIIMVGDSMIEGAGNAFDTTSTYLLNQTLNLHGWEVLNAGVQGASPIYFAANIDRYLSLQPDIIIVVIYNNDLSEDRSREASYFRLPLLRWPQTLTLGTTDAPLWQHSRLLTFVQNQMNSYFDDTLSEIVHQHLQIRWENTEQIEIRKLSPYLIAPSLLDQYWQGSAKYLNLLATQVKNQNVELLIVNLAWEMLDPTYPPEMSRFIEALDEKVETWAQQQNLPFLSLLPTMQSALRQYTVNELIIVDDRHPTELGQRLIAEAIKPWLMQQLPINKVSTITH